MNADRPKEYMKNFRSTAMRGFTLIELLVVISIIAILMAFGAVSYTNAQQKARDAQRMGSIKDIQGAMEQAYGTDGLYPDIVSGSPAGFSGGCDFTSISAQLPVAPTDPKTGAAYNCKAEKNGTATTYCACADLESSSAGNSTTNVCGYSAAGGGFYCVSNKQ